MHTGASRKHSPLRGISAWAGAVFCVLSCMAAAQPDPYPSPVGKPRVPAGPPLPPLPAVKGTIAKAPDSADGKVNGLNAEVFSAIETIMRANPGALSLKSAMDLRAAIIKDDQVDAVEADLLMEITQTRFRSVTITKAGEGDKPPSLTRYPCSGQARTVLRETLDPQLNLEESWAAGASGWSAMVVESKKEGARGERVAAFVQARVADAWQACNPGNGYKPLRDLIAKRYGFTKSPDFPADQAESARKLVVDATRAVDTKDGGRMPDFLHTWWR